MHPWLDSYEPGDLVRERGMADGRVPTKNHQQQLVTSNFAQNKLQRNVYKLESTQSKAVRFIYSRDGRLRSPPAIFEQAGLLIKIGSNYLVLKNNPRIANLNYIQVYAGRHAGLEHNRWLSKLSGTDVQGIFPFFSELQGMKPTQILTFTIVLRLHVSLDPQKDCYLENIGSYITMLFQCTDFRSVRFLCPTSPFPCHSP